MIRGLTLQLKQEPFLFSGWIISMLLLLLLATLPMDVNAQGVIITVLILVIYAVTRLSRSRNGWLCKCDHLRIILLITGLFISVRYLHWRISETITYYDLLSVIAAIMLLGAEIYSTIINLLGVFVAIRPHARTPIPLPLDKSHLPSVDIFIPSYDEPEDLLSITLMAALQVRYPAHLLNVYLLDDGGTVQKRQQSNSERAQVAQQRHVSLQALCARIGCHYRTREKNEHAKAGNINAALDSSSGELLLILDADHVPTVDFLENTVGFYLKDPKLFLVQTPHYFVSPDPIEKNLGTFGTMPSENEMFYSVIQPGLDSWNAAFFCGSAALMRRSMVIENGGISGISITEDAETALDLHSKGYHSVYIDRAMISGLQPDTFSSFILQRLRWAQGMVQIFLLKNPLRRTGLSLTQKLGYTSNMLFWFFPYARIVFLLAPVAYLVFGLKIYDANIAEFFSYALPALLTSMMLADYLYGKVRWTFVSELYETLQAFFSLMGVTRTIINPSAPSFAVTPKGEQVGQNYVTSLARPFYIMLLITIAALIFGAARFNYYPDDRGITAVTMTWEFLNLLTLLGALGVLLERQQRRTAPRNALDSVITSQIGHSAATLSDCLLIDVSISGTGLLLPADSPLHPQRGDRLILKIWIPALQRHGVFSCKVRRLFTTAEGIKLGLLFQHETLRQEQDAVALAFGDSQHIAKVRNRQRRSIGIGKSLIYLYRLSIRHSHNHIAHLLMLLFSRRRLTMGNHPCRLTITGEPPFHAQLENISISGAGMHLQTLLPFDYGSGTPGVLEFDCLIEEKRIVVPVTLRRINQKEDMVSLGVEIVPADFDNHRMIVEVVYQQLHTNNRSSTFKLIILHIPAHLPYLLRRLGHLIMTPFTQKA